MKITSLNAVYPDYYDGGTHDSRAFRAGALACQAGTVAANGTTFDATATGIIAPGVDPDTNVLTDADIWTMDHNRLLSNSQDGVK